MQEMPEPCFLNNICTKTTDTPVKCANCGGRERSPRKLSKVSTISRQQNTPPEHPQRGLDAQEVWDPKQDTHPPHNSGIHYNQMTFQGCCTLGKADPRMMERSARKLPQHEEK
ncbi:hypothetical protein JTB14_023208 [Gonioctena quinquepunctata]|nr:hypothetical protein JTB14_023208 [Gonioctena quinquepunctata]